MITTPTTDRRVHIPSEKTEESVSPDLLATLHESREHANTDAAAFAHIVDADFEPTDAFIRHIEESLAEADAGQTRSFEDVFGEPL